MDNDPKPNKPPAGYEKGLQSCILLEVREKWRTILKESGYFKYTSTFFLQPQFLVSDKQYPTVFIVMPSGDFERHGMSPPQWRMNVNTEFWLFTKHYKRNVNNELDQFIEAMIYLLTQNKGLKWTVNINGTDYNLCVSDTVIQDAEMDYAHDGRHIFRTAVIRTQMIIPWLLIPPPIP